MKDIMYKMFTKERNHQWVTKLNDVLHIYNNRYHRSIKMMPSQVTAANSNAVFKNLYAKKPKTGKLFSVGQLVRISKVKRTFEKGYLPKYTEEVFKSEKR